MSRTLDHDPETEERDDDARRRRAEDGDEAESTKETPDGSFDFD